MEPEKQFVPVVGVGGVVGRLVGGLVGALVGGLVVGGGFVDMPWQPQTWLPQ